MSMFDRLKKALDGAGGASVVAEIERESYEREKVVSRRHELGEQIEAATARRSKEFPPLEAVRVQAVAAFDEARRNVSRCQQAAEDAASKVFDVRWTADNVVRAAKAELRATAEQWLKDAIEYADDRRREFHNNECKKLHSWHDEMVSVEPHPSDPDYKDMLRAGRKYRIRRVCTNTPALDELRDGMRNACERLERMTEQVVPPTKAEVDAILVLFKAHTWQEYASRFTWREPTPPRYDENGAWIGTNLPEVRS